MKRLTLPSLFLLAHASFAQAIPNPAELTLDPAHTQINFTLTDPLHIVHGEFHLKSGTLVLDTNTGSASGRIIVDAASGESGSASRDKRMHKEILETSRFSEAIFVPDHVIGQLVADVESTLQIHGTLTLHGAAHGTTLIAKSKISGNQATADLHFTIPYVAWGIKDPSNFLIHVAKEVTVDIQTSAKITSVPLP